MMTLFVVRETFKEKAKRNQKEYEQRRCGDGGTIATGKSLLSKVQRELNEKRNLMIGFLRGRESLHIDPFA